MKKAYVLSEIGKDDNPIFKATSCQTQFLKLYLKLFVGVVCEIGLCIL